MKFLILLLLPCFISAQTNEPKALQLKYQHLIKVPTGTEKCFIDYNQSLYFVDKEKITKATAVSGLPIQQSIKALQRIDKIDAINAMKIVLFSSSQQQICFTDNTLTLNGECLKFESMELFNVVEIAVSKRPDMLWLFDELNSELRLINYVNKSTIQQVGNLNGLLDISGTLQLKENETGLWLFTDRNYVVLFDDYLNVVNTYHFNFEKAVPYKNGIMYTQEKMLWYYSPLQGHVIVQDISTLNPVENMYISGNQLFIKTQTGIEVFIIQEK